MVSEIPRVSVFGHCPYSVTFPYLYEIRKLKMFNDKSITDWKSSAYIPTVNEIIEWEKSL